jgi:hypothetical protein
MSETEIQQESKLLTINEILNASLDVFASKLGDWPHLTFEAVPAENMKVGSSVVIEPKADFGAIKDREVIVMAHKEPEWAYFGSVDLRLPLDEFVHKHMRIPMTNLAAVVRQHLHDYKRRVVFGRLIVPCGVHHASIVSNACFAMRGIHNYDINTDRFPLVMDVLFGGV